MQQPTQQPNPTAAFDPDQFKQEVINAVQQQLTSFAQNNLAPLAQQQQMQQPPYGQPFPPSMQQAPGYFQQQMPPPYQQPPFQQGQPGQQFGLVPTQSQPMMPFGQQPTMDQVVQAIMLLMQRQEQMFQQIQSMQTNNVSNQNVINAAVAPPYPFTGDRVDRYRWLIDYGLQCEREMEPPRPSVLHKHIAERKQELKELERGLSVSEWWTLYQEKYTGIFFLKY